MNLKILNHSISSQVDVDQVLSRPAFRKATKNMAFGMSAIEKTLEPFSELLKEHKDEIGLILVSNTGELETSLEFLKTLYSTKIARPLLFQNSLHNATTGFLAIQFGLKSPALSISPSPFGEELALETADTLIAGKQCRFCLVVSVDVWPKLEGRIYEKTGTEIDDAYDVGTCFLVADKSDAKYASAFEINKFYFKETTLDKEPLWSPILQSQNTLHVLSQSLTKQTTGTLFLQKPRGETVIHWSKSL